jgi:uncharacterized protein (DUF697 family)
LKSLVEAVDGVIGGTVAARFVERWHQRLHQCTFKAFNTQSLLSVRGIMHFHAKYALQSDTSAKFDRWTLKRNF